MGLGRVYREIRLALQARAAWNRLKEASVNGKLGHTLYVAIAIIVTSIVGHVFDACPNLTTQGVGILAAGIGGGVTIWIKAKSGGAAATVGTLVTGIGIALKVQLDTACPGLWTNLPTLLSVGFFAGLGLWLNSPHDPAVKG